MRLSASRSWTAPILSFVILLGQPEANAAGAPSRWPQFRGPSGSGIADGQGLPLQWSGPRGEGLAWKAAIPGLGHASPVVWDDAVLVLSAISGKEAPELRVGLYGDIDPVEDDTEHEWVLLCLGLEDGKERWRTTLHRGVPIIQRHTKSTHANSTPAVDAERIVAFLGSEGLHGLDWSGKTLWKRDLGRLDSGFFQVPSAQWGFGSSPVLDGGRVYVQCDVQKGSFLAALDAATGEELWRTPRDDVPTWSTPLVLRQGPLELLVVNGYRHMGAYRLSDGGEVWRLGGGGDIPVPTPILGDGLVYFSSAHGPASPIFAVRPGSAGDLSLAGESTSSDAVAWSIGKGGNYMQTPLVHDHLLYACRDNGVLSCFEAGTGKLVYRERLGKGQSGFTASPVATDGRLYFASEEGEVFVVGAGRTFQLLATNEVGEICMATPALAGGLLLVRGKDHLYAFGRGQAEGSEKESTPPAPPVGEEGAGSAMRFKRHRIDTIGKSLGQTALADVDRDGDLDWIAGEAAYAGGEVWWWENQGLEHWTQHALGKSDTDVGGAALDVDGDGWVDLLAGKVLLLSTGKPREEVFRAHDVGTIFSHDTEFADIDGDGRLDAIANCDRTGLFWYSIPADPTRPWTSHTIAARELQEIHAGVSPRAVGDLDGDGDADVVTAQAWHENVDGKGLRWAFHPEADLLGERHRHGIAVRTWVIDLDGDGDLDFIQSEADNPDSRVAWFENDGKARWTRHWIQEKGLHQDFHSLVVADLDLDGDADVFSGGGPLSAGGDFRCYVWENTAGPRGKPTRERWVAHLVARTTCHEAEGGDVDGDGDIDIVSKPWSDGDEHYVLENLAR